MEYVGMPVRTDFNFVSFPAEDSWRVDQEAARSLIRFTIKVNKSRFFRENNFGRPRNLPTPPSLSIPRIFINTKTCFMWCFTRKEDLGLASVNHLSKCQLILSKDG